MIISILIVLIILIVVGIYSINSATKKRKKREERFEFLSHLEKDDIIKIFCLSSSKDNYKVIRNIPELSAVELRRVSPLDHLWKNRMVDRDKETLHYSNSRFESVVLDNMHIVEKIINKKDA